jgi:hypothetical protein
MHQHVPTDVAQAALAPVAQQQRHQHQILRDAQCELGERLFQATRHESRRAANRCHELDTVGITQPKPGEMVSDPGDVVEPVAV